MTGFLGYGVYGQASWVGMDRLLGWVWTGFLGGYGQVSWVGIYSHLIAIILM